MNTAERAEALALASASVERLLGPVTAGELLDWVRLELGHEGALDGFQRLGGQWIQAIAPGRILHVVSGNTPHGALQSLVRGLLLGSMNFCKLPSGGLREVGTFVDALPEALRRRVEMAEELREGWVESADAMIVTGSDETIAHFRATARAEQKFMGHGHRVSVGMVFEDGEFESVALAARDASLFDQQGCLSPHCIYVRDRPEEYAARLTVEMERIQQREPRSALSLSEAAAISEVRETVRYRAAAGESVKIWESVGSDAWTVIFDARPEFVASVLNRTIWVRPLVEDMAAALRPARRYLSTIGIWPNTESGARVAKELGASRVCALGRMQMPAWTWRHDGEATLSPLVSWVGWESDLTR